MSSTFQFTGDNRDILQKLEQSEARFAKLEEQIKKLNATSKKGTDEWLKGQSAVLAELKKQAAMYDGASGLNWLQDQFNRRLQRTIELQNRAAQAGTSVAGSRKELLRNVGDVDPAEKQRVLQVASQIARETKTPETAINAGLAAAYSAKGSLSSAVAEDAVRHAARYMPDAPDQIASVAGSALDLAKVTGSEDARDNLGYLALVGESARVVNPQLLAQNVAPALIGAGQFGATPAEGAALFTALTTASGDFTGATSKTGLLSLADQLRTAMPEKGSMGERIAALQADESLAQNFLKDARFEKDMKGPMEALLTNTQSQVAQDFQNVLSKFPEDINTLDQKFERIVGGFALDPLESSAQTARAAQSISEQALMEMPEARRRGDIRKLMEEARRFVPQAGETSQFTDFDNPMWNTFQDDDFADVAIKDLQRQQRRLQRRSFFSIPAPTPGVDDDVQPLNGTPEDNAAIKALGDVIQELRGLRSDVNRRSNPNAHVER